MSNQLRNKLAREEASKTKADKADEYLCPRDVLNPGVHYGFLKGWDAAVAELSKPELINPTIVFHTEEERKFLKSLGITV